MWTKKEGGRELSFRQLRAAPQAAEEIAAEVAAASQLSSPLIIPPLEVRAIDGEVTIVSVAPDGRSLRDLLQAMVMSGEKLLVSHATWITIEVLKALEAAHTAPTGPVFHGRLSPEHIVLTRNAEVRITGFGLDAAARHLITPETPVIAALAYVSPEQALGAELSAASDVFAVGTILVEALLGEPLFIDETFGKTFDAIENEGLPKLREARDNVPKALEAALALALQKNAANRAAKAADLRGRLQAIQGILDVGDRIKPGEQPKRIADLLRLREKPHVDPAFDADSVDNNPFASNALYAPTRVVTKSHARVKEKPAKKGGGGIVRRLLRITALLLIGVLGVGVWVQWPRLEGPLRQRLPPELAAKIGLGPAVEPSGVKTPVKAALPPAPVVADAGLAGAADKPDASVAEAPAAPPAKPGILSIDSTPASTVTIDGKEVGKTPLLKLEVEPGEHLVELTPKKARFKKTQKILVLAGESRALKVKLK
jgi:serine/threonine-protein kinase